MSASKPQASGKVRIQPSLNKSEEEFVARRRNSVLQSLKKLQIQCRKDEVPNIALLASGGGQRAMVGLLGSLVQLQKADLLDCVLYLGGVSGSTWCMASLYQEPDWSTKLESVKDKIIRRLSGPAVSGRDLFAKLKKYYYGKDFFSLTDIWAVIVMTTFVKEIDEHTLTEQWDQQSKDPLPIYQVIDKQGKQSKERDPWFEITPHEAGYSLTGAFVDASSFGSQFQKGSKKNKQDEFDMLYLQALCGSALADEDEIKKLLWQKIKDFFQQKEKILEEMRKEQDKRRQEELRREKVTGSGKDFVAGLKPGPPEALLHRISERSQPDPNSAATDECYQLLMNTVDMNLSVSTALDESIRTTLNNLSGGILKTTDKKAEELNEKCHTMDAYNNLREPINVWPFDAWMNIIKCMDLWIWGRNYNFLHKMTDVPVTCKSGWISYKSSCFLFSINELSWTEARDYCKAQGALLLKIEEDDEEWAFLRTHAISDYYWIGLTDQTTGQWRWVDDTPYTMNKERWSPGQPDDWKEHGLGEEGEDCGQIAYVKLNDSHCSNKIRFICRV